MGYVTDITGNREMPEFHILAINRRDSVQYWNDLEHIINFAGLWIISMNLKFQQNMYFATNIGKGYKAVLCCIYFTILTSSDVSLYI
jgi:hypothetical protein